ncbi:hypothetical protein A2Z33_02005 [Candidatus Gottesmanbacteria bacterium RBG_16_52_11]|uniref:Uncharacterized protein n=1 Tax=Candidatus Gottesmanbacteria bacterium RBG_16_52_11 TaxID=1798374 RepID=A0A1F5YQS9_9BACT|nr:MAG: hypothetical protein A2Z33_02005 [Candidatus Gottesmanbacteria bacterium RBG_16_52_11]
MVFSVPLWNTVVMAERHHRGRERIRTNRKPLKERLNDWYEKHLDPDDVTKSWAQAHDRILQALPEGKRREAFATAQNSWLKFGKVLGYGSLLTDTGYALYRITGGIKTLSSPEEIEAAGVRTGLKLVKRSERLWHYVLPRVDKHRETRAGDKLMVYMNKYLQGVGIVADFDETRDRFYNFRPIDDPKPEQVIFRTRLGYGAGIGSITTGATFLRRTPVHFLSKLVARATGAVGERIAKRTAPEKPPSEEALNK